MSPWWPWRKRAEAAEPLTPAALDAAALARLAELDVEGEPPWSTQFLRDYLGHLEQGLTSIRDAVQSSDAGQVSSLAHRLKSVSKQVGADDLAELLLQLERGCGDGGPVPEAATISRLEREASRVVLAIHGKLGD